MPPKLTVSLASPVDGSSVLSLTPTLTWGDGGRAATYRLMVAQDNNFQRLAIDVNNIGDLSYTIPSGKLNGDTWYYWKVLAQQGNQLSDWTAPWSFRTPGGVGPASTGTVRVSATLDGTPWSGSVNYRVSGPFTDTDNSVPWDFKSVPTGTYTVTYNYGGPSGASLASITPQPTLELDTGSTVHFVFNFQSQSSSSIKVVATLNGSPWSGSVGYSFTGPFKDADVIVPQNFSNLPSGTYTLTYNSGGPSGAVLSSISPSPNQTLTPSSNIIYTLNFSSVSVSNLSVTASYNGVAWSGPVQFSLSGPINNNYSSVPLQLNNAPPGTYYISYKAGGPPGATLGNIAPGQSLVLTSGGSAGFILNYYAQQQTGNVVVNATLNGSPWSGTAGYQLSGPFRSNDNQVPRTYNSVPVGNYSLTYTGGGPAGAVLTSITPAPTQSLSSGHTIGFNLNFTAQPSTGTIMVNAMVDGQPWRTQPGSGPVSYTVSGPAFDSGDAIPGTFSGKPAGLYTLSYNSGGPIGATLTGISPSPTQNLAPGGSIQYTLQFTGQPKGYVTVEATLDGEPWSGSVGYVLQGPYVESGSSAPRDFANAPQGSYTVQYSAGGPPSSTFIGVSPPSQMLPSGGSITFTLMFHFEGLPPVPPPEPEPRPLPPPLPPVPEPVPEPHNDGPLLK
ncbi:MAG: hypothetical protein A2Z75_04630 [Chloroflexi bacterium RBG_13_50_10]|nr:MAG: hypothetical protein A2Z75_04630 [Chloroflexi bacterium RBG_13_50_10]